jgi:glycosyltransferase involved in cell wall biosynthesis
MTLNKSEARLAFIGSAGVPNVYGGFESFMEHCGPIFAERVAKVTVTCDSEMYPDREASFKQMRKVYVSVPANGSWSVFHDFLAFLKVFPDSTHIVVLGVSGGPWFPLMRVLCQLFDKRLIVNVDGLEWRRSKFSGIQRRLLKVFDALAQTFAHVVVVDNEGLVPFLTDAGRTKSHLIAYSGDHVYPYFTPGIVESGVALTVCRIEPENQIELLIDAALNSEEIRSYTVVGNWAHSGYGLSLRAKYAGNSKLNLLDPIYDLQVLGHLRSSCQYYLHGHSVGGTNPSLVEILFFDCAICAFDCSFNRATARDGADYFSSVEDLVACISRGREQLAARKIVRESFTASDIVDQYLIAFDLQ